MAISSFVAPMRDTPTISNVLPVVLSSILKLISKQPSKDDLPQSITDTSSVQYDNVHSPGNIQLVVNKSMVPPMTVARETFMAFADKHETVRLVMQCLLHSAHYFRCHFPKSTSLTCCR